MANPVEPTSNGSNAIPESGEGTKSKDKAFIYKRDVVKCRKYEDLNGVVMEMAADISITHVNDCDSKDDEDRSGSDGLNKYDSLQDRKVRIIWTNGSETVEKISDVSAVDRSFLPGDVVASSSDPTQQVGRVAHVGLTVDLLGADGKLIKHVSSKDLKRIREPLVGDYVVLGNWLGRVYKVLDTVTVLLDDGSECKVVTADPFQLKPLSNADAEDASPLYFPGQRVRATNSSVVFKTSRQRSSSQQAKHLECTVVKVEAESVYVNWEDSAYLGVEIDPPPIPSKVQDPKNLTLLSFSSSAKWRLGNWCHLGIPVSSCMEGSDEALHGQGSVLGDLKEKRIHKQHKVSFKRETMPHKTFERAFSIVNIVTKVDVAWQDGRKGHGLESKSLIPIKTRREYEFFSDQYVQKSSPEYDDFTDEHVGLVTSVNSKELTVCVRWFKLGQDNSREFDYDEIVSAYELCDDEENDYYYGNVVIRNEVCQNYTNLSWIGNVASLQDGDFEVTWANGIVSKVGPESLQHVFNDDVSDDDDGMIWETVDENEMKSLEAAKKVGGRSCHVDTSRLMGMNDCSIGADNIVDPGSSFECFGIAGSPSDHHFAHSQQNSGGKMWVQKVQKEWSILEKNLPDGIYVRVFEERMDLLRAVIVGPYGTPYKDGLFFFDFHLPPEYPQIPPSVYYHSGGLRLNPNLYECGKVCLSLLNTWPGKENEVWNSSFSNILQVLVSLLGLVLNSNPYFNEPGYEKQAGTVQGEKNALSYNENTYLLNLKSMLYLLRRPPMHFEGFVEDHFRRRGLHILKCCDMYMEDGCVGFKLILAKVLPGLVSALRRVGVDCCHYEHLERSESVCQR